MNFALRVLAVLGLTSGLGSAAAAPITFTGGTASMTKLGDTIGSEFDKINVFAFGPVAYDIPHATPTTVTLSDFDFTVGINALVPQAGYQYTLNVPFTINGVSGVLSQPFILDISYSDTLTLLAGPPTSFGGVTVSLLAQPSVTVGPQSGVYHGHLSAQVVAMPEPATLAVFGGIALAGAVGYHRRKAVANGAT